MKLLRLILEEEDWKAAQKRRKAIEDDHINTLTKHYASVADPHSSTLKDYTQQSYPINNALWKAHTGKSMITSNEPQEHKIAAMDKITHLKTTPRDMTVYSKSLHDPRELKNENGIVHHPAFMSTSVKSSLSSGYYADRNVQHKDGEEHHHQYQINVPKGSHGVFISDKNTIDKRALGEFVLPKGGNFKYNNTETHTDDGGNKIRHYHTHHLDYIGESSRSS